MMEAPNGLKRKVDLIDNASYENNDKNPKNPIRPQNHPINNPKKRPCVPTQSSKDNTKKPQHTRFNDNQHNNTYNKPYYNTYDNPYDDDDNIDDTDVNNFLILIGIKPPSSGSSGGNVPMITNGGPPNNDPPKCNNPLCDHKTFEECESAPIIPNITNITHVSDLIEIGKSYHCKKHTEFAGMNLKLMCDLVGPLTKLNNMIGMETVKQNIVDQILFFLQGHYKKQKCGNCSKCTFNLPCLNAQNDMMHTVIAGSPGTGKTELGKLMGELYKAMGILSKGTFKSVSRADLIGEYLGHTAVKTQKVIDECAGGVLFIDEAYSLGNSEGRDSFSKECIDTLNRNLSEKRDMLCIIAGYKDQLDRCFFKYNEGLNRRFTFRYEIIPYNHEELFRIFEGKVLSDEWKLYYNECPEDSRSDERNKVLKLFEENIKAFPNFGGDIETLLFKCKITHSRRCIFGSGETRRVLSYDDIKKGLELLEAQRGDDKETIKQKQKIEERKERAEERAEDRKAQREEHKEEKEKERAEWKEDRKREREEAREEHKAEEKKEEEKERAKRQKRRESTINIYN